MQVLAHNLLAQFSNRQLNITSNDKKKSAEKLSSGYRINRAADDAAGLKISEKMRYQIRGLKRGERNIQDGISWIQVADGAMSEMHSMVQRVRELAVQASNDTNTLEEREAMQQEISQIKKELNHISLYTEFNKQQVFDNSYVMMQVDGTPNDMNVFNGSYDAATGQVTYGGFIFHGNRITWDQVSPGMVQTDASGKQTFVAGEYTYIDAMTGYSFNISCEDGATVPNMTRNIQIEANAVNGIYVDGKHFAWSDLKNEDGEGLTASNVSVGTWTLNYEGADISFFIGSTVETIEDMADALNSCKDGKVAYSLHTKYVGPFNEQAVDAEAVMKNLQISNAFAKYITSNSGEDIVVRAGDGTNGTQNGIWLEKTDGTVINGSVQTWADMGIHSWEQGTDIKRDFTYTYSDSEGTEDTYISFDFTLSDVTSLDSVIDGLDQMVLSGNNIKTSYGTYMNIPQNTNILKATSSINNKVYFLEEKALGRDFDQKTVDNVGQATAVYDDVNEKALLEFKSGATTVISYEGDVTDTKDDITDSVGNYLDYVLQKKTEAALAGKDPQAIKMEPPTLTELVGSGNITTSGYFDQVVTIDTGSMNMTDGLRMFRPGVDGKTYPSAFIDFTNLGTTFTLDDLVGTGFNSTCKTCNNHYSVMFVNSLGSGSTTANGYKYEAKQQGSNDYLLQIDVSSLKANGVNTGTDLASALVDITSKCYDFHYTQYASEGSKLYIYDDRESTAGTRDATFDTAPYYAIDTNIFNITMEATGDRSISTDYLYDYGDAKDRVIVEMKEDAAGTYVQDTTNGSYVLYNAANYPGAQPTRYNMEVTYKKSDASDAADKNEAAVDYAGYALKKILSNTTVQLDAWDYTYIDVKGNENPNTAVNSTFEAYVKEEAYENVLHIQLSSQTWDSIKIPRISMNNMKIHMFKADVTTWQGAQDAIGYADYAINYISEQRALYGAYQNRLEHAYANNTNAGENATAAESRLRDTDMPEEMVSYSKHNILEQAGQSMLAQANQITQGIVALLQ